MGVCPSGCWGGTAGRGTSGLCPLGPYRYTGSRPLSWGIPSTSATPKPANTCVCIWSVNVTAGAGRRVLSCHPCWFLEASSALGLCAQLPNNSSSLRHQPLSLFDIEWGSRWVENPTSAHICARSSHLQKVGAGTQASTGWEVAARQAPRAAQQRYGPRLNRVHPSESLVSHSLGLGKVSAHKHPDLHPEEAPGACQKTPAPTEKARGRVVPRL